MVGLISLLLLSGDGAFGQSQDRINYSAQTNDQLLKSLLDRDCRCMPSCQVVHYTSPNHTVKSKTKAIKETLIHNLSTHLIGSAPCFSDISLPVVVTDPSGKASLSTWLFGIGSATLLNLASLSGVLFSPIIEKPYFPRFLLGMMGLGCGSMVSVSILTLIPTAFHAVDIPLQFPVAILCSIFVFFLTDQIMKLWQYNQDADNSPGQIPATDDQPVQQRFRTSSYQRSLSNIPEAAIAVNRNDMQRLIKPIKSIHDVPIVVFLVLVSDGLHNFVDGLAVGSAFTMNRRSAIGLVLAILFEELPCELGDFAVFLKAGLCVKHALILNFLGACTNYIGVILGITVGDNEQVHLWIYSIAAGMFLYIGLSIILVEMVDIQTKIADVETEAFKGGDTMKRRPLRISLLKSMFVQIGSIIVGFGLQIAVIYVSRAVAAQ